LPHVAPPHVRQSGAVVRRLPGARSSPQVPHTRLRLDRLVPGHQHPLRRPPGRGGPAGPGRRVIGRAVPAPGQRRDRRVGN
jgi:hypothetical protein